MTPATLSEEVVFSTDVENKHFCIIINTESVFCVQYTLNSEY